MVFSEGGERVEVEIEGRSDSPLPTDLKWWLQTIRSSSKPRIPEKTSVCRPYLENMRRMPMAMESEGNYRKKLIQNHKVVFLRGGEALGSGGWGGRWGRGW